MSKPYWSGPGTLRGSGGSGDRDHHGVLGDRGHATGVTDSYGGYYPEEDVEDYEDYDAYASYDQHDTKWRWVAICAAVVLLVAVSATAVLMYGNDSSTSSTNRTQQGWEELTPSTTPRTVIATVPPETSTSAAPLPPETVVTVTTTPSAVAEPPPSDVAPGPTPGTQTITYTVTGTRQLFDLVTVIYTDEQGFPRTDVNVALPWTKTVVLNPGIETESVTAASLMAQLNCAISDTSGATVVAQNNNATIATCTR
jgi:hypothetical protein